MSKVSYDPETGIFTWAETKRRGFIVRVGGVLGALRLDRCLR